MESSGRPDADFIPRRLTPSTLLDVWERGAAQTATERALTILALACPDARMEALLGLTVGERDGYLLRTREHTFGPELASLVSCPSCGEQLELSIATSDLQPEVSERVAHAIRVESGGYLIECQLPTSRDLAALEPRAGLAANRLALFSRCVRRAERGQAAVAVSDLPESIVDAAIAQMGDTDPQADVHVRIACAACRHEWSAPFEILSFFWAEIDAWAARLRREVHLLASAYGWSEGEILALSPARRQGYVELVAG